MATGPHWQLQKPLQAIIFDCDGTLSTLEGIDKLAEINGVGEKVKQLTEEAMGKSGLNPNLYAERLKLVQPHSTHISQLGELYFDHRTADSDAVILLLKRLDKQIYIISAGLSPSVIRFGELLHIPRDHIFSVDVQFNQEGFFHDFDHSSPLIHSDGKRDIVKHLGTLHSHTAYVGDGLNDIAVYDLVDRFIGYGGAYPRAVIEDRCQYYIRMPSLAPLLPLCLTIDEIAQLTSIEGALYAKGLDAIEKNKVKIRHDSEIKDPLK